MDANITIADGELWQLMETISRRTSVPVDQLVHIALWDFVRSMDWDYEELREGPVYRNGSGVALQPKAPA